MLVPSKHRFAGKGRISGSAEKNFSARLIPASSHPLLKRGLVDMAVMLSVSGYFVVRRYNLVNQARYAVRAIRTAHNLHFNQSYSEVLDSRDNH